MTKDQANELKRLIRRLELSLCNLDDKEADKDRTKLHRKIDSLTQQPAELTDAQIQLWLDAAGHMREEKVTADVLRRYTGIVIAAHKEKQVKV